MSARMFDCPKCGPCIQDDFDSICCPRCGAAPPAPSPSSPLVEELKGWCAEVSERAETVKDHLGSPNCQVIATAEDRARLTAYQYGFQVGRADATKDVRAILDRLVRVSPEVTAKPQHQPGCKYLRSATCSTPIACEHGYDTCPICDPCECAALSPDPTEGGEDE